MSDDTRVAIVAGAAGELGRATAATLTHRGFLVVGIDRSESGLEELSVTEIVSSDKGDDDSDSELSGRSLHVPAARPGAGLQLVPSLTS
jgi:NAD(P)-dependent dehydrogenase (short-subunit alcohol dehydrogenase family)